MTDRPTDKESRLTPSKQCDCRALVLDSGHCDSCGRLVIQQSQPEQTYSEILGDWIVQYAENVEDMGHRVAEVLAKDPKDHHYAGSKLSYALIEGTKALALVGWKEDEVLELVQAAYENGVRSKQNLSRECEGSRS
jgi:hypothetical protein